MPSTEIIDEHFMNTAKDRRIRHAAQMRKEIAMLSEQIEIDSKRLNDLIKLISKNGNGNGSI